MGITLGGAQWIFAILKIDILERCRFSITQTFSDLFKRTSKCDNNSGPSACSVSSSGLCAPSLSVGPPWFSRFA